MLLLFKFSIWKKDKMMSEFHLYIFPHKAQEQLFLDQISITQKRIQPPPKQSSMAAPSYKDESSVTCLI